MIGPRARAAIAFAFFAYVLLIRTYDLANSFLMIGEQIRDWTIALGSWSDLPLTGAPSTAGGRGFGPVYYWLLWIGRVSVGPFTGNLPHAGGIWVALLQSAADTWLLVALWRRVPITLALAMCLFIASAPFDISISGVIWNPPVSAALVKMATAMALMLGPAPALWKIAVTAMLAWLAVQAHTSAIFVAAPLLAVLVFGPIAGSDIPEDASRHRLTGIYAGTVAAVILLLQVPYLLAVLREPGAPMGPTAAINSLIDAKAFRVDRSYGAVVNTTGGLLAGQVQTWTFEWPTLVAAVIVLTRWRRDLLVPAVSPGAILTATTLFATWTRPYDSYWFLTLTAALTLTYGMAIAALRWEPVVRWIGVALLAGVVAWQPDRVSESKRFFSYPQYRAMRLASRELAARAPVLRDIRVTFDVHPTMDKYFMYKILGGRMDPGASQTAFINADGSVRIQ